MRKMIILTIAILGFNLISNAVVSDPVKATMNAEFVIELPTEIPVTELYVADISHLLLKSEEDATKFFSMFTENAVSYQVRYDEKLLVINVHTEVMPDWKVEDWNTYFVNRSAKMQVVFESMFR